MIPGSWQTALCGTLLAFIAAGAVIVRPKKRGASRVKPARSYPVVDYSAARAKAIEWLGPRYLLAKPINRRAS